MIILKVLKVLLRNPPKGYAFKESKLLTDPGRKENQYWGGGGQGEERKGKQF